MDKVENKKQPIHKKWWFWLLAVIIIGSMVFGGEETEEAVEAVDEPEEVEEVPEKEVEETPVEETEAPEPTEEVSAGAVGEAAMKESFQELIDSSDGIIIDIYYQPNHEESAEWLFVSVSDAWYNTPEHEKERFAETVGQAVRSAVYKSGVASVDDTIVVDFVDAYEKELATYSVFSESYKIKR